MSVAAKKGTKMAANWSPARRAVRSEPFPLLRSVVRNGPEPVKGAPLLGAAKRTLDGEDRSEMIAQEGKAGRKIGERWSAILVPSPAASNIRRSGRSSAMRRRWRAAACLAAWAAVTIAADSARQTVNSIGMTLIEIPAGSFQMGVDSRPSPTHSSKGRTA